MIDSNSIESVRGATVRDNDGDKIGTIGQIYVDPSNGSAAWFTVRTGLFGTGESFVPATEATMDGDDVRVEFAKDFVKDAPRVDSDGDLDDADTDRLYTYYGYSGTGSTGGGYDADTTRDSGVDNSTTNVGYDTSGPTTDDAMTRSEEQLRVGTEQVETGRARLHKYVVTEQQTVTVPVSHEEAYLVSEPITEANRGDAYDGPAISEEEHEVALSGERVVVDKEAVPVERVRIGTETVTDQQNVTEDVRKERIEADGDVDDRTTRRD